jgi:N-acetylmuramoyl-L-alanine amidase
VRRLLALGVTVAWLAGCGPAAPRAGRALPATGTATATAVATKAASVSLPLQGRVVVLDPGHGSHSGASSAAGQWEDDNVLAVARDAVPLLQALGADVRLTRSTPAILGSADDTDLTARVADAVAWHADVFVSLHENWSTSTAARGVETFSATPQSQALARDLQAALVAGTGLADQGLGHRVFWVIACNPMPAVLIEAGYLSNPDEAAEISSPAFQLKEARAIAQGLATYFRDAADPVGAEPLPPRLQAMCAMDPVQAKGWITEQYRRRQGRSRPQGG